MCGICPPLPGSLLLQKHSCRSVAGPAVACPWAGPTSGSACVSAGRCRETTINSVRGEDIFAASRIRLNNLPSAEESFQSALVAVSLALRGLWMRWSQARSPFLIRTRTHRLDCFVLFVVASPLPEIRSGEAPYRSGEAPQWVLKLQVLNKLFIYLFDTVP